MVSRDPTPDEQLADALAEFYADPLGYVMFCFPWDTDKSIRQIKLVEPWKSRFNCEYGPDKWQCEFLDQLGEEIKKRGFDGRTPVMPIQFSTASGHGIGKSTLTAWLIKFILDTRPYSKGVVTAGKADQLKTKTWAELAKWHKMSLTAHWFNYNSGRGAMNLSHRDHPERWRCDAQTCKEENADSFAGLHAVESTPFYIFDEASVVPDKIFEVRQGGLTDGEPMVFDFGNPTIRSGYFFENCEGKFKDRYIVRRIDSRTCSIANTELHEQWIHDYGIDSDFVKVRVLGEFPSAGTIQFISDLQADLASKRDDPEHNDVRRDPLVIGVDVARFGDDESVIYPRIGRDARSFEPRRYMGLDTMQLVGKIIECVRYFRQLGIEYSMIFVDEGNMGAGVVDRLRELNYKVTGVAFGKSATNKKKYKYVVDEIWGKLRDDLDRNLVLPSRDTNIGKVIYDQLTARQFGYVQGEDVIRLEAKKDMKARGVGSPDVIDALAVTYYFEVEHTDIESIGGQQPQQSVHEYDPLEAAGGINMGGQKSSIVYRDANGQLHTVIDSSPRFVVS